METNLNMTLASQKKLEDDELPLALFIDVGVFSMDECGNPKHELILYKQTVNTKQKMKSFIVTLEL